MKKLLLSLALTIASLGATFSQTVNFFYTGAVQTYTVPPCVFTIDVTLTGGEGGGTGGSGGDGALVTGTLAVTPGQVLQINVGGAGTITAGGFNGGGIGKPGSVGSGGGGGGSDIRIAPYAAGNRVAVAGGGGGFGGGSTAALGGSGGDPDGTAGASAYGSGGGGGTSFAGGAGGAAWGACGSAGAPGVLVNGGAGGTDNCYGLGPGGGGGGGLYGGGGGGADDFPSFPLGGGGGGGGSSLTPAGGTATAAANTGNGLVTITPIGGSAPVTVTPSAPVICDGGSVVLTAVGATSYTWSPAFGLSATTGAVVTANPNVTTTYTLTGTTGACSTVVAVTVTVNPLPVVTATPSPSSICSGGTTSISLTSTVPGTTYAWTAAMANVTGASAGTGATIAQTLTTTVPPTGTATYTITPTDPATGCVGVPVSTVVNVDVAAISSIVVTDVNCFGAADGTITITSAGATLYSINGGTSYVGTNFFTVGPGTYPIMTQSPGGCIASGTATVTEPTALVVPMSFTDASCAGVCDGLASTAPSGGTLPYSYSWSTGITGTPTITSACAGSYTVTVTDGNGCSQTGTTTVSGPVSVTITSVTPSSVLCNGGSTGQIVIVASASATQFSINGGGTFQPTGTFTGLPAGTYNIEVQDVAGCNANAITTITQPTALTVTPSPAQTICFGQTATIFATPAGATPGYTFAWTDATGTPVGATGTIVVTPTNVGANVYTVNVTDNNGCGPVTTSVTVTMNPQLTVTASADQTVCPGDPASISAIGGGGNGGPYTYTWSNNTDGTLLFGADQTVNPSATSTTYTITLTDGCGTPAVTDVVVVSHYALPAVGYTIDDDQGCTPVVVNFTNTTVNGLTFTWDFGDGGTGSGANPMHVFTEPGCHDISLTVITNDGCTIDTIINNQICVFAIPLPDFTANPQPTDIFNPDVTFTNLTIGGAAYGWDFGGLGTSNATNPVFEFPNAGATYSVCLNTISSQGCTASVCHDVVINDVFLLYVPNSFTPDGDGVNDLFTPIIQGNDPETYEFRIFNRWGETIFMTANMNEGWDGTHKGIKAKEDVYVWKVRAKKSVNREVVEREGNINLLR